MGLCPYSQLHPSQFVLSQLQLPETVEEEEGLSDFPLTLRDNSPINPIIDPLAEGKSGLQALYPKVIKTTILIVKIFVFMLEAPLVADSVVCFWN